MNIILFDDEQRFNLLPLSYTRPCGDLRLGILTLGEKWSMFDSDNQVSFLSADYLATKFPTQYSEANFFINGRLLAESEIFDAIKALQANQALINNGTVLAVHSAAQLKIDFNIDEFESIEYSGEVVMVNNPSDMFTLNDQELRNDFERLTAGRESQKLSDTNTVIGDNIFVEEGVSVEAATINTTTGPVYIGKDALIMEGSLIRGPFAACDHSVIKMGAKIYGATTVGPHCKVGGEMSNVMFQAHSNKGHDGFLGNSVIGEWCNLGADTNSSNLKNNYAPVKLWNYTAKRFLNTGLQFCGLIMGDHSKCGINTMFNTGTVVGVSANIFGAGFPRNFIPSFTWGGSSGFSTYTIGKSFETASKVMARRNQELTEVEKDILKHIFEASSEHRFWENKPLKA